MHSLLQKVVRLAGAMLLLAAALPVRAQETPVPTTSPTLSAVLERGELVCGVNQDLIGFGSLNPDTGDIVGIQVEMCRALAAAIFGDTAALQLLSQTAQTGPQALIDDEIDVLFADVPVSLSQDARERLSFGPAYYFDGLSFMVGASSNLNTWADLNNATICLVEDSSVQNALQRKARMQGATVDVVTFGLLTQAADALFAGGCDALTALSGQLIEQRTRAAVPDAYTVWTETYTQVPMAPMFLHDDALWGDLVTWTVYGLIQAEILGINSENVDTFLRRDGEQDDAYVTRVGADVASFLDPLLGIGGQIGLTGNYILEVIRQVGNYGEIYARHLGAMNISRGLNALVGEGGILYAPSWG